MIEITFDYLRSQRLSHTFPLRLWSNINIAESGCWIWTRSIDSSGYGSLGNGSRPKRKVRTHVAAWLLTYGPVPMGLCVLHNCPSGDTKRCVNPLHLYLGTHQDNARDRQTKCQTCAGENRENHKLKWTDVKIIRASHLSQKVLSEQFHIHPSIISHIINFKRWRRAF